MRDHPTKGELMSDADQRVGRQGEEQESSSAEEAGRSSKPPAPNGENDNDVMTDDDLPSGG
jgi:hypothetical protein